MIEFRRAAAGDLIAVIDLLEGCDLPTDDVPPIIEHFWVALRSSEVVGAVALESHGTVGLLRSLAVDRQHRSVGVAGGLCDRVLQDARDGGISELYLLTTDADGYFTRHGFVAIDRAEAPDEIRGTQRFADLCPDSAILMQRTIAD